MTPRPSHLGGDRRVTATPSTPIAAATVVQRYQDVQTRQWFMAVQLEGGRIIRDVRMLNHSDGRRSGRRPRMPAIGSAGLVVWSSFKRQGARTFWIGSFDNYVFGVDSERADEELVIHPNFAAEAHTIDGGQTNRFPGGDVLYHGPDGVKPREFRVRPRDYHVSKTLQTLDETEKADDYAAPDREYVYNGLRHLKRVAFALKKGHGIIRADVSNGEIEMRSEKHTPLDRPDTIKRVFMRGQAGEFMELWVDQTKPTNEQASLLLDSKNELIELTHKKPGSGNTLRLKTRKSELETDLFSVGRPEDTLAYVSSAPPTQDNLETLAQTLASLRADVQQLQIQMTLAPTLDPLLIPLKAVPRPPVIPIRMKRVESTNLKSKKGGVL